LDERTLADSIRTIEFARSVKNIKMQEIKQNDSVATIIVND
jgi:hypothetical protein